MFNTLTLPAMRLGDVRAVRGGHTFFGGGGLGATSGADREVTRLLRVQARDSGGAGGLEISLSYVAVLLIRCFRGLAVLFHAVLHR